MYQMLEEVDGVVNESEAYTAIFMSSTTGAEIKEISLECCKN